MADTSQRAIENVRKEPGVGDEPIKSILEGFELTERELQKILESHGVKRMDPLNSRFDPNQHQAMMEVERPDVPAGTVVQVFQPAYMIEDRVLRPAMVVVSRGGPKVAKAPAEGASDAAESAAAEVPPTDGGAAGDPPAQA